MREQAPLNDFGRKTSQYLEIQVKYVMNVISACYENSNVNETLMITNFHLNTAVLLIFFKIFVNGDVVNAQTRRVLPLKNPIEPGGWTVY